MKKFFYKILSFLHLIKTKPNDKTIVHPSAKKEPVSSQPNLNENTLIYPYTTTAAVQKNGQTYELNCVRRRSMKKLLNKNKDQSSLHEKLAPYYEHHQPIRWLGIISDINMPYSHHTEGLILIDKFAVIQNKQLKLLDHHVWLNINNIKYIKENNGHQVLAIGDAITGLSKVRAYRNSVFQQKYGLYATILIGAGIFVGKRKHFSLRMHLISDYNRQNDWTVKLKNGYHTPLLADQELLNWSGHVTARYQPSQYQHYYERLACRQNNQVAAPAQTKRDLNPKQTLRRYQGEVSHLSYISRKGKYRAVIRLQNITNAQGKMVQTEAFFKYSGEILQLGYLTPGEKITFEAAKGFSTKIARPRPLQKVKLLNHTHHYLLLPQEPDVLLGMIMSQHFDNLVSHQKYLQKYYHWQKKHHLHYPGLGEKPVQKSIPTLNHETLVTKEQIAQTCHLSIDRLSQILTSLLIYPLKKTGNISYYSNSVIKKVKNELELEKMMSQMLKR